MRAKNSLLICFSLAILIVISSFVSADYLNLTLSTSLNGVTSDFVTLTNDNATLGYDGYDFDVQTLPSGYTRIYSTVSTKNLAIDSWNSTSLPRTINLTFQSSGISGSSITYSWQSFGDAYNVTLYDYGSSSTRSVTPNTTDLLTSSSYTAPYSSGSRYLSLVISERAASVSGLEDTIYACEGSRLSHDFTLSVFQDRTYTLNIPANNLGASISTGSVVGATTQTVNLYSQLLEKADIGSYTAQFSLIDQGSSVLSRTMSIDVLEINNPPTISATDQTAASGIPFSYKVSASDVEDGSQNSGNLSFSLSSVGGIQSGVSVSNDGTISFTPTSSDEGVHSVRVCVSDLGRTLSADSLVQCSQTNSPLTTCDTFSLTIGQICSGSGCDTGNGGVSGTGDSGGGGGGPNTLTPGANATLKVVFSPDELIVNAVKGDDNVRSIKITNNGAEAVSFYAEIFGLPFNNSLNPEKMTLNPGESKQVKVSFSNYELGLYTGKIVFKLNSGVVLKEIKVIVNVRTSNFLFDVRVGLPFGGGSILPGEKLIANVNLDKIGVANNITKVSVYYVVKTFTGETVYEKGEDVDVVKGTRYSKEIPIESLPLGDYVLGIEVVYPGAFAAASTQFSVVETKPFNKTILIVIALVVVAVALAWVARVRRKRIGFG
jgi:hypothetical protein